jgi:hypothetical protein
MAEPTTSAPAASLELPRVQVGSDPDGWNNANAQSQRDLADRLGLTRDIESIFAKGMTASQVTTTLREGERFGGVPLEEQAGLVIQTRATLGIPSRVSEEGAKEFEAWKQQRDVRIGATQGHEEPRRAVGDPPSAQLAWLPAPELEKAALEAAKVAFSGPSPASDTTSLQFQGGPYTVQQYRPGHLAIRDQQNELIAIVGSNPAIRDQIARDHEQHPRVEAERDRATTEDIAKRMSDLAARMKGADWSGHLDNPPDGYRTTPELGAIERDLRALATVDVRAAHVAWTENAPKVFRVPEHLAEGAPPKREPEIVKPEAEEPVGQNLEALKLDPATQEAVALRRAVEAASAARELGLNMIEPEPRRERGMDEPGAAKLRTQAKADVNERDPERDVKRDAIDRANDTELAKFAAVGKEPSKVSLAFEPLADRLRGEPSDGRVRKPSPPLEERFNVVRGLINWRYEFRDQPGKVAFEDRLLSLRTSHSTPSAATAMMDRAGERGWSRVRVNGTEEFKRQAWIAAEARDMKAVGYEPTKGDQEAARAERARLEAEQAARAKPADREPTAKRTDAEQVSRPAPDAAQAGKRDSRASDEARSAAKEDRKTADYQAWASQPGALDRARNRGELQREMWGDPKSAVLRAFDLAMERQGIAAPQQVALRKELGRQLDSMQATGRTPLVKVYDKDAPRVHSPAAPKFEHRRGHAERVR